LRKIFTVHQKFFTFPITNMWQVYTRPTSASDFFYNIFFKSALTQRFTSQKQYLKKKISDFLHNLTNQFQKKSMGSPEEIFFHYIFEF
jgi:hypothetical protein